MDIVIPDSIIISLGVSMGVCLGVPAAYIVANRHKIMLVPIVVGIISYCVLTFFLCGVFLGTVMDYLGGETAIGSVIYSLLCAGVIVGGHFLVYKYLAARRSGGGVPLSYGLGYASLYLVLINGAGLFSNISLATAINNNGFDKVAGTVENSGELYELVKAISESSVSAQLLGAAELICFFIAGVAVAVFIWYAVVIEERRRAMLVAAFVTELLTTGISAMYSNGFLNERFTGIVYVTASVAAAALAFRTYRKIEGGPEYMADPVTRL